MSELCRFCGIRLDILGEPKAGEHEKTCPEGPPPVTWNSVNAERLKEWAKVRGYVIYEGGEA